MLLMMVIPRLGASGFTVPETISGVENLTAQSLVLLAQGVDDLKLIDARLPVDRYNGFIEDSIFLSDLASVCAGLKSSVTGKQQSLVFYSNGIHCGRSAEAVKTALDCGYSRVYWLRGGFDEWLRNDFPYLVE